MAEMPKTVRLIDKNGDLWFPVGHLGTEYIRADLVDELVKALEPFAKAGSVKLCGEWRDDERFGHTDVTFHLTFGDLRRALAALTRIKGDGK